MKNNRQRNAKENDRNDRKRYHAMRFNIYVYLVGGVRSLRRSRQIRFGYYYNDTIRNWDELFFSDPEFYILYWYDQLRRIRERRKSKGIGSRVSAVEKKGLGFFFEIACVLLVKYPLRYLLDS